MENKEQKLSQYAEMEAEVSSFWQANQVFEKSVAKAAPHGDYVFYDGPPFATGTPHYGHIVGSVMKDVIPRFWTMNGYRVERKWGWDCHGLPIENIVEKEFGMQSKKDIENMGVDKFNELCRSKVLSYVEDWKTVVNRLGRFVDMENDYKTMDFSFMESIWSVFKNLYDKDLIYEGYRSMHICPRCETTLSQSEVSEGYKDIKDLSCVAKFELVDEPGVCVLAWTTTPWTLIGNVALAVGAEIEYARVTINGEVGEYILASERIAEVLKDKAFTVIKKFPGSELIGLEYQPLFGYYANNSNLENRENGWKIYGADFVTTTDGVGVVHIAPAFGEDDLQLGKANSLPFVQHVGMDGAFKSEVTDFSGLHVKPKEDHTTTDIEIIKYLAHHGLLFSKTKYEHSYPHCWRCDTPLLNYATSSWFVNVTKIKDQALDNAKNINWSPEHIKEGRFGNWLEGARDWSISRQRFWASVMPIWRCACGETKVFGSAQELHEASGILVTDLHKHVVDKVTFKCAACGGEMKRISDVLDCWFESGSMPYAQLHYPFENKEKFENNFPAQFIAEGVDQTRCWFYYLHIIATGLKETQAFDNVIVNGIVQAEDGKKMSKKLKNYPDPTEVLNKYSADALRAYLLASPVMQADNLNFSEKGVQESLRKNVMLLWNVYKFYEMYAAEQKQDFSEIELFNVLDKWIIAKLHELIKEVTEAMRAYNLPKAMRPITEFIDELSTWYVRRSRDRFKGDEGEVDQQAALATTKFVLEQLARVMAPFTPFIAEQLWQKITGFNFSDQNRSVHLEVWPDYEFANSEETHDQDKKVLRNMSLVRKIVELGLAERDKAGIKVRQRLNKITVNTQHDVFVSEVHHDVFVEKIKQADYTKLITDELNVVEVEIRNDIKDELLIGLDINITPELRADCIRREMVRLINSLRKEQGLTLEDRVLVSYQTKSEVIKQSLELFKNAIIKDTLSSDLLDQTNSGKELELDGELITLSVVKI